MHADEAAHAMHSIATVCASPFFDSLLPQWLAQRAHVPPTLVGDFVKRLAAENDHPAFATNIASIMSEARAAVATAVAQ